MAEITYIVEPSFDNPVLLARLRFPDLSEAISKANTTWKHSPALMDLMHGSDGEVVTEAEARKIAASWGALLDSK